MTVTVPRALVDTNVFVNYLLSGRRATGPVTGVMTALERNRFVLLLPDELLSELTDVLTTRRYFLERIDPAATRIFIGSLRTVADLLPGLSEPAPAVVRDVRDDYLLEQAKRGRADFLVTGDKDLLALADVISRPRIVSPADFLTALG